MFKGSSKQLCASVFQSIITGRWKDSWSIMQIRRRLGMMPDPVFLLLAKILVLQVIPAAPNSAGFSIVHHQFISCWAVSSSCKGKVVNETFVMMIHVPFARPLVLTTF